MLPESVVAMFCFGKAEKSANGASDSFRGNRYTGSLVLPQNEDVLTTAEKIGKELGREKQRNNLVTAHFDHLPVKMIICNDSRLSHKEY